MKIVYASNVLIDASAQQWESNFICEGARQFEIIPCPDLSVPFLRDNGNMTQTLRLRTVMTFASHVLAQVAQLCAFPLYPTNGPVTITCGEGADTPQNCYSANAILSKYNVAQRVGVSLFIDIELICQPFTTSIPPGFVNPNTVRQVQRVSIPSGQESYTWTYPIAFTSGVKPVLSAMLNRGADATDPQIECDAAEDAISNTQAKIKFSAPTPNANYVLNLIAEY